MSGWLRIPFALILIALAVRLSLPGVIHRIVARLGDKRSAMGLPAERRQQRLALYLGVPFMVFVAVLLIVG